MADSTVQSPTTPTTPGSLTQSQTSLSSSTNDDIDTKSNDEIAGEMAADLTKFLNFSVVKEEAKFNDSVEMMLTKLDEFFSLVDMIRSDTSLCLTSTVPDIQAKCSQMEAIFEKIDKMEEFVNTVKDCVAATEETVVKAEADFSTVGGLVKKLTSFVSMKKTPTHAAAKAKKTDYVPPEIFSTKDFFPNPTEQELQKSASMSSQEASFEASGASFSS